MAATPGAASQRGQAVIYGLAVLAFGVGVLYFVQRTGTLVEQKIRLVDTADAAAYSAAVLDARVLNFDAYTNRAMLADSVSIGQLVSLSSWLDYASHLPDVQSRFLAEVGNPVKYPAMEAPLSVATGLARTSSQTQQLLAGLRRQEDTEVHEILMLAQVEALATLPLQRQQTMDAVAGASGYAPGALRLQWLPGTPPLGMLQFIQRDAGAQRQRFADMVLGAVDGESFNTARNWLMPATYDDCPTAELTARRDMLVRRGGTNLLSLDEWRAVDTLSDHVWVPAGPEDLLCDLPLELPGATGLQDLAAQPTSFDADPTHYGASELFNPLATSEAQLLGMDSSNSSYRFQGIPAVYALSDAQRKEQDPRLRLVLMASTAPAAGRPSQVPQPWADSYSAQAADGRMVAVSAAEVYFDPPAAPGSSGAGLPNLFQPYWRAHLVASPTGVREAQALQGVQLP